MTEQAGAEIKAICRRIAELREERGITQTTLAERCGIQRTNLSRLEGGFHAPSLPVLLKILNALGAPWAAFDKPPMRPCDKCDGTGYKKGRH
jgi:transcriptional regulator with XRE-family HTH domain